MWVNQSQGNAAFAEDNYLETLQEKERLAERRRAADLVRAGLAREKRSEQRSRQSETHRSRDTVRDWW